MLKRVTRKLHLPDVRPSINLWNLNWVWKSAYQLLLNCCVAKPWHVTRTHTRIALPCQIGTSFTPNEAVPGFEANKSGQDRTFTLSFNLKLSNVERINGSLLAGPNSSWQLCRIDNNISMTWSKACSEKTLPNTLRTSSFWPGHMKKEHPRPMNCLQGFTSSRQPKNSCLTSCQGFVYIQHWSILLNGSTY